VTAAAAATATLCKSFGDTVARVPDQIALRTLSDARTVTWGEYGAEVASMAAPWLASVSPTVLRSRR